MNAKEIVKRFITALQSGAIAMAAQYMTDDFKLVGWMPQPPGRGAFLTLQAQLDAGMPDFSYNLSDLHAHADTVTGLIQIAATHTRDLAFPQSLASQLFRRRGRQSGCHRRRWSLC